VKVKVVSKDMGAKNISAKAQPTQEYSLAHPRVTVKQTFVSWKIMLEKTDCAQTSHQSLDLQKK
jgi:hypothetical protein